MENPSVPPTQFDQMTRYVRVRNCIDDRFVEFDFAIGDASLYVELVIMTESEAQAVDADMEKWRYSEDGKHQ